MGECDKRKVNRTSFVSYISPHLFILFTSLTKNGEGEGYGLGGSDISDDRRGAFHTVSTLDRQDWKMCCV